MAKPVTSASLNPEEVATILDSVADGVFCVDTLTVKIKRGTIVRVAEEAEVPLKFALDQNYPNPFNPTTVVSCQWPVASTVNLVVYDVLGREVARLAEGFYPAGKHSFTFIASNLATG